MDGLTKREIMKVVKRYIGVSGGYLGDFSYASHSEFYAEYCDLDLNPWDYLAEGTTQYRFIAVLEGVDAFTQAKILRGVVEKYPPGSAAPFGSDAARSEEAAEELLAMAQRLERGGNVAPAVPAFTSAVVVRAIDDAEALLKNGGPTSAVDRIHTTLHGHLLYLCESANIPCDRLDTMVALLKKLRQQHPQLQPTGARSGDVDTILKASGSILDTLNPVRNNASVAHPNEELLGADEAQLVINIGRTLLAYLDGKIGGSNATPSLPEVRPSLQ